MPERRRRAIFPQLLGPRGLSSVVNQTPCWTPHPIVPVPAARVCAPASACLSDGFLALQSRRRHPFRPSSVTAPMSGTGTHGTPAPGQGRASRRLGPSVGARSARRARKSLRGGAVLLLAAPQAPWEAALQLKPSSLASPEQQRSPAAQQPARWRPKRTGAASIRTRPRGRSWMRPRARRGALPSFPFALSSQKHQQHLAARLGARARAPPGAPHRPRAGRSTLARSRAADVPLRAQGGG